MTGNSDLWKRVSHVMDQAPGTRFANLLLAGGLEKRTDLRHANLRGCDLSGGDFSRCDLVGTNLTDANLTETDLSGSDMTGAKLDGARLHGANLTGVTGLDDLSGIDPASFDSTTKWPIPPWAAAAGRDQYGPWASFTVPNTTVTQRLRWCPPPTTSFQMGSPPDEEGRYGEEDLSDPIAFAQGYWIFETPCTQALWTAVMGKNPSHFKGPDRPVEQVSFKDANGFIKKLNRLCPGLNLALPSEAQWEYACRGGTKGATWLGPAVVDGKANKALLDRIAWYGDNSEGETHPVGEKEPNPWGLHDMLGNVYEWCADVWHDSHDGADPGRAARAGGRSAGRVIRGGSWSGEARLARAGARYVYDPVLRHLLLGFRCVRGPSGLTYRSETRPAGTVQRQRGDRASRRSRPGAASSSP